MKRNRVQTSTANSSRTENPNRQDWGKWMDTEQQEPPGSRNSWTSLKGFLPCHHLAQHTAQDMLKILLLTQPTTSFLPDFLLLKLFYWPLDPSLIFPCKILFCFSYMLPNLLSNNLATLLIVYTFVHFFLLYNGVFPLFCWYDMFREYNWKVKQYFENALIYYHLCAPPYFSLFQIFSVYHSYKKTQPTNCHPTHTELLADYFTIKLLVSQVMLGKFLLKYKTQNPLYTLNNL